MRHQQSALEILLLFDVQVIALIGTKTLRN